MILSETEIQGIHEELPLLEFGPWNKLKGNVQAWNAKRTENNNMDDRANWYNTEFSRYCVKAGIKEPTGKDLYDYMSRFDSKGIANSLEIDGEPLKDYEEPLKYSSKPDLRDIFKDYMYKQTKAKSQAKPTTQQNTQQPTQGAQVDTDQANIVKITKEIQRLTDNAPDPKKVQEIMYPTNTTQSTPKPAPTPVAPQPVKPTLRQKVTNTIKNQVKPQPVQQANPDAVSALVNSQIPKKEATTAVSNAQQQLGADADIKQLITAALKNLASGK